MRMLKKDGDKPKNNDITKQFDSSLRAGIIEKETVFAKLRAGLI